MPEYRAAGTIFAYKWIRGEVRLDALERRAAEDGKRIVYPLCVSGTVMIAVLPGAGDGAWRVGPLGISEPVLSEGTAVAPEEIDLAVCPCSAFDEECRRLGMGGGYYDRWLAGCQGQRAGTAGAGGKVAASAIRSIAVAFEVQKADSVPSDENDRPVDAVVTELGIYRRDMI